MTLISTVQSWIQSLGLPTLLIVGAAILIGLYVGKTAGLIRLPSIIGYMVVGVLLGPSLLGILDEQANETLSFIPSVALGFVAVSIGLELSLSELKREGWGIAVIILAETVLAFVIVAGGVYLLSGNLPLALVFGAIAPASAPAGTVAIIQEYRARGTLTKALYAVVGFDDGLGIVIFGFASAVAVSLLSGSGGDGGPGFWALMGPPLAELAGSLGVGVALAFGFSLLARRLKSSRDVFILTFSVILIAVGISESLHLSLILTNMVIGFVVVNTQPRDLVERIRSELTGVLPLLFVLFFVLAGANLHVAALPSLGLTGLVYAVCRSAGLMGGAWLGGTVVRTEEKIRKYLGMGILSQAGVAIGLALIVKQEYSALGPAGEYIGATVITTITATSILFELVGPILTKVGLKKAGEIDAG